MTMRRRIMYALLIIAPGVFLNGCSFASNSSEKEVSDLTAYTCQSDADCISTCGAGCANKEWVATYKDTCMNIRAFECSCVNNQCFSDGNSLSK